MMLDELQYDMENGRVYISARLSDFGVQQYPALLRSAFEKGTEQTLANDLQAGCFKTHEQRRKPKGGFSPAAIPATAHVTLAEGEFNRYYIRALCRRAIDESYNLEVYRAKQVSDPRPASLGKIGQPVNPQTLLSDLRDNIGIDTHLGLPAGPNSGLSVRF